MPVAGRQRPTAPFSQSRMVNCVEIVTEHITLPREAGGLGLMKLSGLIGTFLGSPGTVSLAIVSGGIALIVCFAILYAMKDTGSPISDFATPDRKSTRLNSSHIPL